MLESTDWPGDPHNAPVITKFFMGRPELSDKATEQMIGLLQEDVTVP